MMAEEERLPADIDAQPVVQAAAALRPVLRRYHEEIERGQRLPPAVVEQLRAAGFYRLVIPRALGGLEADPLTYLRVVELLAEGVGSVGWNIANNGVGQLITLGLPEEGVHEIYAREADAVIAGTAVPGGGQAVPVAGGYRVSGRWSFGSGCLDAGEFPDPGRRPAAPPPGRNPALLAGGVRPRRSGDRRGELGCDRAARDWQLRMDGRGRLPAGAADDDPCRRPARQPMAALAGGHLRLAGPGLGRAASQRRDDRHRAGRHRCVDRARRREDAAGPDRQALREPPGSGRGRTG